MHDALWLHNGIKAFSSIGSHQINSGGLLLGVWTVGLAAEA